MQYHTESNSSFSMMFSMSNGDGAYDDGEMSSQYSSSSVDCTLSLGTPSTRLSTTNDDYNSHYHDKQRSSFGWNTLPSSKHSPKPSAAKNHHGNAGDPLLARRCANCDTTSTPLWRNGPRGPKSLCNACGIRFKKEERRAAAAASNNDGAAAHMAVESQYVINNSSWVQPQKMPSYYSSSTYGNDYQHVEEYDCRDSETGIPYMSWLST